METLSRPQWYNFPQVILWFRVFWVHFTLCNHYIKPDNEKRDLKIPNEWPEFEFMWPLSWYEFILAWHGLISNTNWSLNRVFYWNITSSSPSPPMRGVCELLEFRKKNSITIFISLGKFEKKTCVFFKRGWNETELIDL